MHRSPVLVCSPLDPLWIDIFDNPTRGQGKPV
jgi:hypothetical protein